jgi:hypothetical protein
MTDSAHITVLITLCIAWHGIHCTWNGTTRLNLCHANLEYFALCSSQRRALTFFASGTHKKCVSPPVCACVCECERMRARREREEKDQSQTVLSAVCLFMLPPLWSCLPFSKKCIHCGSSRDLEDLGQRLATVEPTI